jgi:hypothetical protein
MGLMIEADEKSCRVSGGVILKVTYGWTVKDADDYFVALIEQVFVLLVEIGKSGWLVNIFPICEPIFCTCA